MDLAAALLQAVHAQDFGHTADAWRSGQTVDAFPSIDLAVASFASPTAPTRAPRFANVLFSREHPQGLVAEIGAEAGAVQNIRFDADQRDRALESPAWLPGADWSRMRWTHLHGAGAQRVVAPYPASLLKLMVAVGVGLAVDAGKAAWPDELEAMIVVSDNDATDACVALLHRSGMVAHLNQRFQALGLHTLQLNRTTPRGGWRNADGAGVGQIHMTAWDSVRLLWLLDSNAPPAPWLPAGTGLLLPATRERLRAVLSRQERNEVLSSGSLRAVAGWLPGLQVMPDAPHFAHKTGTTNNYASDAGIVQTADCHYLVAVLTSLGRRYAPHESCATTWKLPALGAAVHQIMETVT